MSVDAVTTARVALVIERPLLREGIRAGLATWSPTVVVGYAAADLPHLSGADPFDVVVLDSDHRDRRLLAGVARRCQAAAIPFVLLGASPHPAARRRALATGARAYLSTWAGPEALVRAVSAATADAGWEDAKPPPTRAVVAVDLSAQERRAVQLYVAGLTLGSVARRMNVAPTTAKEYLDRARRKYSASGRVVRTRLEMYVVAIEENLLEDV